VKLEIKQPIFGRPASMANVFVDGEHVLDKSSVEFFLDANFAGLPMLTTRNAITGEVTHYKIMTITLEAEVEEGTN
jgi:hypothetical protein